MNFLKPGRLQNLTEIKKINIGMLLATIPIAIGVAYVNVTLAPAYAIAVVVALALLFVVYTNTDYAIYALIFFMLLSPEIGSRDTQGSGVTIRLDDVILGVIVITWIAKMAVKHEFRNFKKCVLLRPMFYYMLACLVSTAAGMIRGNVDVLVGFFFLIKYFQYFVIFLMVFNQIKTQKQIDNYLMAIIITYLIVVFVAIAQIPSGNRLTAPFEGKGGEPNTLGGYLILIITINLSIILTDGAIENRKARWGLLAITALSVFPYLLTNSRGSWLAGIPVVIGFMWLSKKRWIIALYSTFLLIASPFVIPKEVFDRARYTFERQQGYGFTLQEKIGMVYIDPSASERLRSWIDAFIDFPKHPLIGFGITGWRFLDAQYVRTLIETGLVGLIVFILLQKRIIKTARKIKSLAVSPRNKALALGFTIATVSMIFHSLAANTFIIIRIMSPYWVIAGLVMSIPFVEGTADLLDEKKKRDKS